MDSPAQPPVVIRFGSFELDLAACELRENGALRKLPAQPFRVLALLIERTGDLVTRQEIRRCLWGERKYVDVDDGINFCVNQIRSALRDPAELSRFIKTVPRRGYRFVPTITRRAPLEAPASFIAADPEAGKLTAPTQPTAPQPGPEAARSMISRVGAILLPVLIVIALSLAPVNSERNQALIPRGSIVLADFINMTGDAVFDDTLTQALIIELRQSPTLELLPDSTVRGTLRMMGLSVDQRMTPEVARELCQRAGSEAVLEGRISSLGGQYLLSINAKTCAGGETLASVQGEASRKEDVLAALSPAAARLRTALGESLPAVQRPDAPAHVTTTSLEALKSYTMGLHVVTTQGDAPSIPFFKRALELDPKFALANATLASRYSNLDQTSAALQYGLRAYELRDGVTERERLVISALFYRLSGEIEKSTQIFEMWKSEYPRDARPHASLGVNYYYMGQYEKAAAEWEEALRRAPDDVAMYENLAVIYTALNHADKAQALLQAGMARHLDSGAVRRMLYSLAFLRDDHAEMNRQAEWAVGKPGDEDSLLAAQSDTEAYFGRVSAARRFLSRAVDSATRADFREAAALCWAIASLTEAEFGNRRVALGEIKAALALAPGRNVKVLGALALARAGETRRAEALAAELESDYSKNTVLMLFRMPAIKAAIELSKRNPRRALEILAPAEPFELGLPTPAGLAPLYSPYLRGQAYLMLHNGAAAAAEFQKIRDHPGIALNFSLGALAQLQRARAAVLANDAPAARSGYRDFLALWKEADSDVPVLIAAKAELASLH
ncbi:MAG TPA: winged helix-turn-helix domain-containing protein [Steroidobacteraceae bacterium]|jgi:DNA-binding winged helix-turn-helix (wHTH) protein/tetratricopeptide (TPR) repeat protein|nr:winged helix-turn-helix domain-containing protein [Steroidobacteraceae bacterium]